MEDVERTTDLLSFTDRAMQQIREQEAMIKKLFGLCQQQSEQIGRVLGNSDSIMTNNKATLDKLSETHKRMSGGIRSLYDFSDDLAARVTTIEWLLMRAGIASEKELRQLTARAKARHDQRRAQQRDGFLAAMKENKTDAS
jgi:hypothetical protein